MNDIHNDTNKQLLSFSLLLLMICLFSSRQGSIFGSKVMLAICCFIVVLVLCWIWKGLKNYVCIYWHKNRQWMFCNFFLRRIWQHCWAEEIIQKKQWMHKNPIEWPNINIEQLVRVTNKHRINDLINRVILQSQTIL